MGQPFPHQESRNGREGSWLLVKFPVSQPHVGASCWASLDTVFSTKGKDLTVTTWSREFRKQHNTQRCCIYTHLECNTDNCVKTKVCLHLGGMKTEFYKMESFVSDPNKTLKDNKSQTLMLGIVSLVHFKTLVGCYHFKMGFP